MNSAGKGGTRLPVVICESDGENRAHWTDVLSEMVREEFPSVTLDIMSGQAYLLKRVLDSESGVMLVLMAMPSEEDAKIDDSIRLFLQVMEHNRDSYVVVCVRSVKYLTTVLSQCMRTAGIMLSPFEDNLLKATLRRIISDYITYYGQENDEDYLIVTAGRGKQRIAYKDILYLEAQDKLLNINLKRNVISVRMSLNALEESLPEDFIRCHRSFIVNRQYVEKISTSEMMIYLTTEEKIPISRAHKTELRDTLKTEGWV
ncbi:MAG: LytTR family transcriptional regulator DNA-binding domain-containing protein [Clostridia bacterium]|nr:LytTR family transcriptional regulator DNA-binding domain-containing protein [Clostridia bacterium]MBQ4158996.1 LytTR family transcriptional regulator DNA-binding domain-containing protein [Clostridia bacterium]